MNESKCYCLLHRTLDVIQNFFLSALLFVAVAAACSAVAGQSQDTRPPEDRMPSTPTPSKGDTLEWHPNQSLRIGPEYGITWKPLATKSVVSMFVSRWTEPGGATSALSFSYGVSINGGPLFDEVDVWVGDDHVDTYIYPHVEKCAIPITRPQ